MLIQFNFKNFKVYKNEVSLDMTASSIKEHPYNTFTNSKGERFVNVAAIYGANASGKTAVLEAFSFMRYFILNSFNSERKHKNIPVKRFAFDKESRNGKSEFEVFFTYNNKEYQYGFVVDNKKVYEEWLYKRDFRSKHKYNTLFERDEDNIICGETLKDANLFINMVEDSTLFLSLISNAKISEAKNVFNWFLNTPVINYGDAVMESMISHFLPARIFEDKNYIKELESFLKLIDVDIEGIRIEKVKQISNDDDTAYIIYSKHKSLDEDGYFEIPFSEESSGTQKIFCLYRFVSECIKKGYTLMVDELDAKLHPLLLRYIINLFHNPDINKNGAQLIYTTHDISTLTKDIYRRDQIWFADKNEYGVSELYSLVEYKMENDRKVRNDATYNKDYLAGRYGAIPLLEEFNIL